MYTNDYIWLRISCPVNGCSDKSVGYWSHHNCPKSSLDHDIKINSAGYLKCNACDRTNMLIHWRFNCGNHHDFIAADNLNKLCEVLAVLAQATTDQSFVGKLMISIGQMYANK